MNDFFNDINDTHPENFEKSEEHRLKTLISLNTKDMHEMHKFLASMARKEKIANILTNPYLLLFALIVYGLLLTYGVS